MQQHTGFYKRQIFKTFRMKAYKSLAPLAINVLQVRFCQVLWGFLKSYFI